jgi:hypothetical protein
MNHDERFGSQVWSAVRADAAEHITLRGRRIDITEGTRIAFDVVESYGEGSNTLGRHEGTVAEVWFDQHPNGSQHLYLEVLEDDGTPRRAWAARDHVDLPGTFGAKPNEGMLW